MRPKMIEGGRHEDGRGVLRFCNGFDMAAIKRFYTIANGPENPVRGWIGHRKENKWFFPIKGATIISIETMDAGVVRSKYVLTAETPSVLNVPGGNWFCIEQHDGAEVMVFSDCKVGEYENDDFRRVL